LTHKGRRQWLGLKWKRVKEIQEKGSCVRKVTGEMAGLGGEVEGHKGSWLGYEEQVGGWVKKSLLHWVKICERL
jgi:hypothetical protein